MKFHEQLAMAAIKAVEAFKNKMQKQYGFGSRYRPSGRKYPEQSLRQANRRFRRAQGGPGLDANNQPRDHAGEEWL